MREQRRGTLRIPGFTRAEVINEEVAEVLDHQIPAHVAWDFSACSDGACGGRGYLGPFALFIQVCGTASKAMKALMFNELRRHDVPWWHWSCTTVQASHVSTDSAVARY